MSQEIELKVPVSQEQFNAIFQKIYVQKNHENIIILESSTDKISKSDEYFTRYNSREEMIKYNEPQVIRIRTEIINGEKQSYFTIKRKTLENGIEVNKEDETFLENDEALRILFEEAGYKRWFYKEKSSYSSYCALKEGAGQTRFHLELVTVNGMNYVEVELVINDDEAEAKAGVKTKKPETNLKAELEKFIIALGLNPADKDPRSWYQIISENDR
jgi:adenylate cyclase class IV